MKLKVKNLIILIIAVAAIIIVSYLLFFKKDNNVSKKEVSSYSKESLKQIDKLNIKKKIDLDKYSKTLDIAIFSNFFNKDYVTYYENIKYVKNDNIVVYINKLASEGLAINEIDEIFQNYLSYNNFEIDNAKRYTAYQNKNPKLDKKDIVTRVNLNLDKEFYTDTKRIKNQDDMYALVNKFNYLDTNYVPDNLKPLFNNSNIKMVGVAADAYEEFVNAASSDGITFVGTTAYRSASWQQSLYDNYVAKDGKEAADRYSARPGYSEHQLGYSVDLNDPNYSQKRLSPSDYEWLKDNSYKYGFIIRYPENTEDITGYEEEDWHIRYVGKDIAKQIHDLNITYDEYYDLYLKER